MELLDNKTPQVEFDRIHAYILAGMSTNKSEISKVNGYGSISKMMKFQKKCIVHFTSVPYTLQEDVKSCGNQL